jgi:hypothetical protein
LLTEFDFGSFTLATRLIVSEETLSRDSFEVAAERLDAVDNLSSSGAVDGCSIRITRLGMLDQGIAFQTSLELVVSQVVAATGIRPTSKRRPELVSPAQPEMALPQVVVA